MFGCKSSGNDAGMSSSTHKANHSRGHRPAKPRPLLNQGRDTKILNHSLGKAMNSYDTIRNMVERGDKVVSPAGNVAGGAPKPGVHIGL